MALFNLFGKNKKPAPEEAAPLVKPENAPLQDALAYEEASAPATILEEQARIVVEIKPEGLPKKSFFGRIKSGLSRTRNNLGDGLAHLFLGAKQIDDDLFEQIETQLLVADVGIEAPLAYLKSLAKGWHVKTYKTPKPFIVH